MYFFIGPLVAHCMGQVDVSNVAALAPSFILPKIAEYVHVIKSTIPDKILYTFSTQIRRILYKVSLFYLFNSLFLNRFFLYIYKETEVALIEFIVLT